MHRVVSSKDFQNVYDKNILKQGMQFQIDTYYEPKTISGREKNKLLLEFLNPRQGERILDIGCGVGTYAFLARQSGASTFGVDYSIESIKMAHKLIQKFGLSEKAKFIIADATVLPFKEHYFDKIVANSFIEHINFREKELFLSEVYRVLKPNGIGIICTPNGIRERISEVYWRLRHLFFKDRVPFEPLHLGLITRAKFESLLKKIRFNFQTRYLDTARPYLSNLYFIKYFLALEIVWVIKKRNVYQEI